MAISAVELIQAAQNITTALAPDGDAAASLDDIKLVRENLSALAASLDATQKATLDQLSTRVNARLATRTRLFMLSSTLTPEQRDEAKELRLLSQQLGRHGHMQDVVVSPGSDLLNAVPTTVVRGYNWMEGQIGRVTPEHASWITAAITAVGSFWLVKKILGLGKKAVDSAGDAASKTGSVLKYAAIGVAGFFGFKMLSNAITPGPAAGPLTIPSALALGAESSISLDGAPTTLKITGGDPSAFVVGGRTFTLVERKVPEEIQNQTQSKVIQPKITKVNWNGTRLSLEYSYKYQQPGPPNAQMVDAARTEEIPLAQFHKMLAGLKASTGNTPTTQGEFTFKPEA